LIDGFSKATGGKYGRDFTWENYLTSFATSAVTSKISSAGSAGNSAGAWERAGRSLGTTAANGFVSDTIRRNTYGSYDADKETGMNFLERTLQSEATSSATDLAKYGIETFGGESGKADWAEYERQQEQAAQKPDWIDSTLDFLGVADIQTPTEQPKNALAAEQKINESLRAGAGLLDLSTAQASAYGIEPGAMVDTSAGDLLGGIDGVTFDDDMRARLGVETVGLSNSDTLPITTDSPDSLAYLENLNQRSVAENNQTSHPDAQYLEDAILSGDVLVRGFNETEAVITNEVLSNGDVTSKQYEIDYADYESINQATYELDLFDFDVANGFAERDEVNPFTQLYGDISSSLTEYGNYASVSFDEGVTATNEKLGEFANGISDNQEGLNAFYDGVKIEAANDGNLPKYLAASFGQSFGNFGYNVVGFGANLLGNQTRAAEQWDNFGEYSLETSEGTNALEVEGSIGFNFFGAQVSAGIAIGADNQGRMDIAAGFNFEPNTDISGAEWVVGINVAKAKGVDSVTTLVNGYSTAFEVYAGNHVGEITYGQGYLHQDDGSKIPFSQVGGAIGYKEPLVEQENNFGIVNLGISGDVEEARSLSYVIEGKAARGYDLGWVGKATYGLINVIYGNSLDEFTAIPLNQGKK